MGLTVNEIQEDVAEFQDRIALAKSRLSELPEGYLPLKQHKAREKQRREYESEIQHCRQLIVYANEGIQLRLKESG